MWPNPGMRMQSVTIEPVTLQTIQFVFRYEQLEVDGLDPDTVADYLFEGPGYGKLLFHPKENRVFGHFLHRMDRRAGVMYVDRLCIAADWEALWLQESVQHITALCTHPLQGMTLVPVWYVPLHALNLQKTLTAVGYAPSAVETVNHFQQDCLEFRMPLDDFTDTYVAARAKKVRAQHE